MPTVLFGLSTRGGRPLGFGDPMIGLLLTEEFADLTGETSIFATSLFKLLESTDSDSEASEFFFVGLVEFNLFFSSARFLLSTLVCESDFLPCLVGEVLDDSNLANKLKKKNQNKYYSKSHWFFH